MRDINLCTLFDKNYLTKGLALLSSIGDWMDNRSDWVRVFVLAMDEETENAVETFASVVDVRHPVNVRTISYSYLERNFSPLQRAREDRSYVEYLWTLAAVFAKFCSRRFHLDSIAYLDSDTCFFNELDLLYDEIRSDVCIVPHRWCHKYTERLQVNGTYNVSWVYFHGSHGMECLTNWRNQVLDWCKNEVMPDGRFADQGYLEDWPEKWGAQVIAHPGIGLAPWNQEQYHYQDICLFGQGPPRNEILVDGYPLVFYHFHEFKQRSDGTFYWTGYPVHPFLAEHLYPAYERRYLDAQCALSG